VYPGLAFKLVFAAHSNVRHHLAKLARDGRVICAPFFGLWSIALKSDP
jgi:hypothetical protein